MNIKEQIKIEKSFIGKEYDLFKYKEIIKSKLVKYANESLKNESINKIYYFNKYCDFSKSDIDTLSAFYNIHIKNIDNGLFMDTIAFIDDINNTEDEICIITDSFSSRELRDFNKTIDLLKRRDTHIHISSIDMRHIFNNDTLSDNNINEMLLLIETFVQMHNNFRKSKIVYFNRLNLSYIEDIESLLSQYFGINITVIDGVEDGYKFISEFSKLCFMNIIQEGGLLILIDTLTFDDYENINNMVGDCLPQNVTKKLSSIYETDIRILKRSI